MPLAVWAEQQTCKDSTTFRADPAAYRIHNKSTIFTPAASLASGYAVGLWMLSIMLEKVDTRFMNIVKLLYLFTVVSVTKT